MIFQKKIRIANILILLSVLLISTVVGAEGIKLEDAIKIGLSNNSDIISAREEVAELQRELASLKAQEDWHLDLSTDYSYAIIDGDGDLVNESSADLSLSKTFSSGLTLNPEISITGDELTSDFSITASQSILPSTPTETQKSYYQTEKSLVKAEQTLIDQKSSTLVNWVTAYLDLSIMYDKEDMYNQTVKKAEKNLEQVKKEIVIGEGGENDLITAQLSLKEAQYSLQDIKQQIDEAQLSLVNALGLDEGATIKIEDKTASFVTDLRKKVNSIVSAYLGNDDIYKLAEDNSLDIYSNLVDRETLKKELEWLQKENQPDLDLVGSYDSSNKEYTLGVSASYSIYDSGEHELDLEDKEAEIKSNKREYRDLIEETHENIKSNLNSIDLAKMNLEKEKLTIEKNNNDLEIAEKQLEMGLIDYLEYQGDYITAVESEIELQSLADDLFIKKLKFVELLDYKGVLSIF